MISVRELGNRKCEEHLSGTTELDVEDGRAERVPEKRHDQRSPYYHGRHQGTRQGEDFGPPQIET